MRLEPLTLTVTPGLGNLTPGEAQDQVVAQRQSEVHRRQVVVVVGTVDGDRYEHAVDRGEAERALRGAHIAVANVAAQRVSKQVEIIINLAVT